MLALFEQLPEDVQEHSRRVAKYTEKMYGWALDCGVYPDDESLREDLRGKIHTLALWHDIGKLMVPEGVLFKPGRLNDRERDEMRRHVEYARILHAKGHWPEGIGSADRKAAMGISYYHHERWDGKGYLCGLRGTQIPAIARICAIADTFDAIVSQRPYKQAEPIGKAIREIRENTGTQFDPLLVNICGEKFEEELQKMESERL